MNPNCITKCEDPEAQDTQLMKTLNNNYFFSYFPTKIVKIRSLDKPFITMGLKGLSRKKMREYKKMGKPLNIFPKKTIH